MAIRLVTFGGLHAVDDAGELDRLLAQHSRAALFVHLAVERRVPRESVLALFWPESDAENARHALRQSLYHVRRAVGVDWIETRPHELVVRDEIRTDAHDFERAIARGDVETAVQLYRGPFLDGVHLVDLASWERWVDGRRAHYARAFRKACRDLLDARRAAGDLAGAVAAAERWTARDPTDDEAQHRLIEALADAGERAEAIRQYEAYARMLEPEGLTPLDETERLIARLRAESGPLPTLRAPTLPTPSPTPAPPRPSPTDRRRSLAWAVAGTALVALVGLAWGARAAWIARAAPPSPTTIAVLPFSVRGAPAASYLRDGMVNLLGTALDGAGSLRPTDTRATFAAVAAAGGTVLDAPHAERVAARLGAGTFVLGDVIEAGGRLQIDAAVYDVGVARPRSRAAVSGAADSVFELVDRLAARLLGGLGDPAADRLLRTAAFTTDSLAAFKAYLDGEALMRAGWFERAADDYLAAIAIDSTFAVAHYRLALAREWAPLPGEEEAASAAVRHGARLSARDRLLLEAFREWRAGDAAQAERAYRAILSRYPDDIEAWSQLGEIQFHYGMLVGRPVDASEAAWRRVLSYEPRNLFALMHLGRVAAAGGRSALLDSLLAPFDSAALHGDRRLEELTVLRAVARGDTTAARALARNVGRQESLAVWRVGAFLTAFAPDPVGMRVVLQELSADVPPSGERADLLWFASLLDLAAGRVDASRVARAQAADAERALPAERRRPAFDDVTDWFAATLPLPYADSLLASARQRAAAATPLPDAAHPAFVSEMALGAPIRYEPLRQYALGILSLRLRDVASARLAAARLERLAASRDATALVRDLDRGLRAALAWQAGRPADALRLLEALECRDSQGDVDVTPFDARANERFLHGEVLAALGRDAEALSWFASLGTGSVTELPLRAPSELRQAEIYARRGDRTEAVRHYTRVLQLWRAADPALRPAVDSVHRRVALLTGIR